ncbi:MAG: hypothetical protein DRH97_00395 [Chloroflexi bacterium]|nr:MAG: hypothetical protein DRH97_00395 [Chloroflexota bacterium]
MKEMWKGLTDKQKKFIVFYVQNGNGTQSAIKAGYAKDSAHVQAFENLIKPNIKPVVDWMTNYVITNSLDISICSKRDILQKLSRIFTADQSNFLQNGCIDVNQSIKDGSIVALAELTTRRIAGHDDEEDVIIEKIKLHDPVKVAAEISKLQGFYEPDKLEHSGDIDSKLDASQLKDAIKEVLEDDDC